MYSKFTIKSSEKRQWRLSDIFIVNFKQISHIFGASIVDFVSLILLMVSGMQMNKQALRNTKKSYLLK